MNMNKHKASYYIAKNDDTFEKVDGYVMPIKFPDNKIRDIGLEKKSSAPHFHYVVTDIATGVALSMGESTIQKTLDSVSDEAFLNKVLTAMKGEFYQKRLTALEKFLDKQTEGE